MRCFAWYLSRTAVQSGFSLGFLLLHFVSIPSVSAAVDFGVFSKWVREHGTGIVVGINSKQNQPCLVQIKSGKSSDSKTVVVHFNSSEPRDLRNAVSNRNSNMVHVFARNFRTDGSNHGNLIQTGTFFRRLEIPFQSEDKSITEFRRLDVLRDSYPDNCVGPFTSM